MPGNQSTCFYVEQVLLCSTEVADRAEAACEQPRRLLLAEQTVIPILLTTRHPAVGTPGFLEQPARAAAWLVSRLAPLTGQALLGPERAVGLEAVLALLSGNLCPLFLSVLLPTGR